MLLFLKKEIKKTKEKTIKKKNETNKRQQYKQKQQQHIITLVYITGGDAIRQLL